MADTGFAIALSRNTPATKIIIRDNNIPEAITEIKRAGERRLVIIIENVALKEHADITPEKIVLPRLLCGKDIWVIQK